MSSIKSIYDIAQLKGKKVLLRTDYNVAFKGRQILDTERIDRTFATIRFLIKHGASVIIISHLGRPDGKRNQKYSLRPIAAYIAKKFKNVSFINDCQGAAVERRAKNLLPGQILVLENLRFYSHEENNDRIFAKKLAGLADIYTNDAFGVSHRKHASVYEITKSIPSYAGLNMLSEINNIDHVLKNFKHPGLGIIGGVKISTKIRVVEKFLKKFELVIIGGALANNFLVNLGYNIGKSFYEPKFLNVSKSLLKKYSQRLLLPADFVVSNSLSEPKSLRIVNREELSSLGNNFYIVDTGPKSIKIITEVINHSKTIVWNGPLGIIEVEEFAKGTKKLARAFAERVKGTPFGLIGGGETLTVANKLHLNKKIDFISTGGGAMLEYIENGTLPGIAVLKKNK